MRSRRPLLPIWHERGGGAMFFLHKRKMVTGKECLLLHQDGKRRVVVRFSIFNRLATHPYRPADPYLIPVRFPGVHHYSPNPPLVVSSREDHGLHTQTPAAQLGQ